MRAMEGIMPRKNLWNANVPRVELDQRVRDARLRLERIERLLVPRAAVPILGSGGSFIFSVSAYTATPHRVTKPEGR
jgi:hypothetical protein